MQQSLRCGGGGGGGRGRGWGTGAQHPPAGSTGISVQHGGFWNTLYVMQGVQGDGDGGPKRLSKLKNNAPDVLPSATTEEPLLLMELLPGVTYSVSSIIASFLDERIWTGLLLFTFSAVGDTRRFSEVSLLISRCVSCVFQSGFTEKLTK